MKTSGMKSIVKDNRKVYEDTIAKRGYLFPEDEGVRYAMLTWFERLMNAAEGEEVEDHITWILNQGIKLQNIPWRP